MVLTGQSDSDGQSGGRKMADLRNRIDAIDAQLVSLWVERLDMAAAIGKIKHQFNEDVFDPVREKDIIARLREKARGKLTGEMVEDIFRNVISSGRAVQGSIQAASPGQNAGFSHPAAIRQSDAICVSIMAKDTRDALMKMGLAAGSRGLLELRLDVMQSFDLSKIMAEAPKPLLVTYRSRKEGGLGNVSYSMRVAHLKEAAKLGAHYVDVEYSLPLEYRRLLFEACGAGRILLSRHFRNGTPSDETLEKSFRNMAATGAHGVKIVTHAHSIWDNFRVLRLISVARKMGVHGVAFCMGEKGRVSRVLCPLLGGMFTFAALERGQESAPGQLTAEEIKGVWKVLS